MFGNLSKDDWEAEPPKGRAGRKVWGPPRLAPTYVASERPRNWRNMWKGDD